MSIFSTAYLPPISYALEMMSCSDKIEIEQFEHYTKQTYRNRCILMGANGPFSLSIPVLKKSNSKTQIKDLRIKYDENWQHTHWKSITSAYLSSPFFMYYENDLKQIYSKKYEFLLDLNEELYAYLLDKMNITLPYSLNKEFQPYTESGINDFRNSIHPKTEWQKIDLIKDYKQVFSEKFEFQPNLSLLDLLCNEGQNAENYLKSCLNRKNPRKIKYEFPI